MDSCEAVAHPDRRPAERPDQLGLVVAGHAERGAGLRHRHHLSQHARGVRAAVDQVAHEHRGPALRVSRALPPEPGQQSGELRGAAVHVTDEVEARLHLTSVLNRSPRQEIRVRGLTRDRTCV